MQKLLMSARTLFLCSALLFTAGLQAQWSKGTRMLNATIASGYFSDGHTDYVYQNYRTNNRNWSIGFTPSYGVFISDRSAVGASIFVNAGHQKNWNESNNTTYKEDKSNNSDYGLGVFLRHYLAQSGKLHFFGQVYVNGGSGASKTDGYYYSGSVHENYTGKSSGRFFYNTGINAGVTRMLSSSVGLEAFIGYSHSYSQQTMKTQEYIVDNSNSSITYSEYNSKQKYSGNNLNIGIGLQVFLQKARK